MAGEERRRRKSRMTLPKKREDLDKVVSEVAERHAHEHHGHEHHHHHHHGDLDELLTVMELLLDSINANVKVLETNAKLHAREISRLYKILALLVRACLVAETDEEKARILEEALEELRAGALSVSART